MTGQPQTLKAWEIQESVQNLLKSQGKLKAVLIFSEKPGNFRKNRNI